MKTIAEQLKITEFPFVIKDSNNNRIYLEDSNGKIEDIYSEEYFSIRDFVNSNKGMDQIIAKLYNLNIEDVDDNLDGELGCDTEVIRKVLKGKGYRVTYNDYTEYIIVKRYKSKLKQDAVKLIKMKKYIVGKSYRYSEIPEESTDELQVNDYGSEHLGQNAIHLRDHKTETDVWFIWDGQTNEGIFKCVYNS